MSENRLPQAETAVSCDRKTSTEQLAYQLVLFCDSETIPKEVALNALLVAFCSMAEANKALTEQATNSLICAGVHLAQKAHSPQNSTHLH